MDKYLDYASNQPMRDGEEMRDFFDSIEKGEKAKTKPIYTHNLAADMIELFEDELDKRNIKIPDEDRTGDESEAAIYGMTYANLLDDVESVIVNYCEQAKVDYVPYEFE